jgi:hypothetical protein
LHTEAGKRYLIDANGQPFMIRGDTPWSLAVQLTREQVDVYLENRRAKGFNTILFNVIEKAFSADPPRNVYGNAPFTTPGDFSTPNEVYFAHVDYILTQAAAKGMLVLMTPAYMGFNSTEGWYPEIVANGETKVRAYATYLANRFKAHKNLLWVEGGDFNPPEKVLLRAIANGIRGVDASALQTFHGTRGTSALGFLGTGEAWLNVNSIYTTESTVVPSALTEYARSTLPFILLEARYENEGAGTETVVRTQAYQAMLSGGAGQLFGNNPVWKFATGWETALNSPGATTLTHLKTLLSAYSWWTLVPDANSTFLTAGAATGTTQAAASLASTGAFGMVYLPSSRTVTIAMSRLSGPNVRARWFDPTNGVYTTVSGSPFAATGTRTFTPTGNNSRGLGDWVLVLDSVP